MSWPHWLHEPATVLAIVFFVLTIPLNLLTNLAAPIVRDRWSSRSLKALVARKSLLTNECAALEALPLRGVDEDDILSTLTTGRWLDAIITSLHLGALWWRGHALDRPVGALEFESLRGHRVVWPCGDGNCGSSMGEI